MCIRDRFAADAYDAVYAVFNAMKKTGVNNVKVDPTAVSYTHLYCIAALFFFAGGLKKALDGLEKRQKLSLIHI